VCFLDHELNMRRILALDVSFGLPISDMLGDLADKLVGCRPRSELTPGGDLVRADARHEPDLLWAVRGGGGVGVVTALEMRLYPVRELYAGDLFFPIQRAAEVLYAWREWTATVPDEVTSIGHLLRVPPLPEVPEPLRGRAFAILEAAYLGDAGTGAELIQPLCRLGPEVDTVAMIPAAALGQLNMDPSQPVPAAGDGAFLADFPAAAIDALVAVAGPEAGTPPASVEIRHLGGALARPVPGGGAQPSIDASYLLYAAGPVRTPGLADPVRARASGQGRPGTLARQLRLLQLRRDPGHGRRGAPARLLPPPAGDQSRLRPQPGDHLRPPRLAGPAANLTRQGADCHEPRNPGDGRITRLVAGEPWPPHDDTGDLEGATDRPLRYVRPRPSA
jgi:hypothetical protein